MHIERNNTTRTWFWKQKSEFIRKKVNFFPQEAPTSWKQREKTFYTFSIKVQQIGLWHLWYNQPGALHFLLAKARIQKTSKNIYLKSEFVNKCIHKRQARQHNNWSSAGWTKSNRLLQQLTRHKETQNCVALHPL